jgi:hypothetical protein
VTGLLDEAGFPYEVFSDVAPNPPIENVRAGLAAFREAGADVLIAVGGGSPQDTCKAVGIIAANPEFEDVRSLEGVAATANPSVPIVAIPRTAGTASETTITYVITYVITDTERQRKFVRLRRPARHPGAGGRRLGDHGDGAAVAQGRHRPGRPHARDRGLHHGWGVGAVRPVSPRGDPDDRGFAARSGRR